MHIVSGLTIHTATTVCVEILADVPALVQQAITRAEEHVAA
jgi:hypothetical protein